MREFNNVKYILLAALVFLLLGLASGCGPGGAVWKVDGGTASAPAEVTP